MKDIQDKIKVLKELELKDKIVIPLLRILGARDVHSYHGVGEHGKDILYTTENIYRQDKIGAIILKACDIKTNKIKNEIQTQMQESLSPFVHPLYPTEGDRSVGEITVMTSGELNKEATEYFHVNCRKYLPNIHFVSGCTLAKLIAEEESKYNKEHPLDTYTFDVNTFRGFCIGLESQTRRNPNLIGGRSVGEGFEGKIIG